MLFAENEIKKNLAEYVLYLWQMEDLLRAVQFDLEKIRELLEASEAEEVMIRRELNRYQLMIDEMRQEGVLVKGHLSRGLKIIREFIDLHGHLLLVKKDPDYQALYQLALPNIKEFLTRSGNEQLSEVEACFQALYGLFVLRLKKQPVSKATEQAMLSFSKLLAYLAGKHQIFNPRLN